MPGNWWSESEIAVLRGYFSDYRSPIATSQLLESRADPWNCAASSVRVLVGTACVRRESYGSVVVMDWPCG